MPTSLETATASADAISQLTSRFMLDPSTYAHGGELGFNGIDFYVAGRGGVLGDVDADVVSAAFVFFNPVTIRAQWEIAGKVMSRHDAAVAFAGCLERWSERVPDDIDCARLAALTGQVVENASPSGAPIFAAWRLLDEPAGDAALACHRMNALRELRLSMHGAGVLTSGLRPIEALLFKTPYMAQVFGWEGELPDVSDCGERWQAAEDATNVAMAPAFDVLADAERAELVELANAVLHATA
jgi:hypothetical protein